MIRELVIDLLVGFDWFVLAYFLALNSSYLVLIAIAARATTRSMANPEDRSLEEIFANPLTPPISIVIGAYNEEVCIVESVRATLALRYPQFEVVVVDDGSTDSTFELLEKEFDLIEVAPDMEFELETYGKIRSLHVPVGGEPIVVVRKTNEGGKRSDAMNAGINVAKYPLVCCVDADSILEKDALLRVAKPFVDDPERVVASGGAIRAINGSSVYRGQISSVKQPKSWLARIQIVEYLRSFLLGRTGWSEFGGLLIISGAFGLYRRDILVEVGGFDPESLGEDADALVGIHRLMRDRQQDYRAVFVPGPACWTEVPDNKEVLGRQRIRWSHGLVQVLWKYRRMMLNPRYGKIGMVSLPYYLLFEAIGPVVELVGFFAVALGLYLGVVSTEFALLFMVVALLYGIVLSVSAILVEEVAFHRYSRWRDLGIAISASIAENFGYRQINAWWRLKGIYNALRGKKSEWGVMTRTGFGTEVSSGS